MWYLHLVDYYSAIKMDETMIFTATWVDLEIIILSQIRQIAYDITYMWNLKYDTNELTYETGRLTDIENIYGCQQGGRDGVGVWGWQMRTCIYRIDK